MTLRDILVIGIVYGSLPACLSRPWIGVLVWSWIGYMNPHRLTWGAAYRMPFAQVVALATLLGLFLTKERRPLPRTSEVYLLIALWFTFFLSTQFAIYPELAWPQLKAVSKVLLMTFVTLWLFQDRQKLRALLYVMAMSIGIYGLKGGIWGVLTGGQYMVLGPEGAFIEGNTNLGLALNMVLPMLLFLSRDESRSWLRYILLVTFGFSIIATLLTYSRGAFIGLAVVLTLLLLKNRANFATLLFLAVSIYLVTLILPEKWFGRVETIETYEEDRSATGRLRAWHVAYKLALDRPILGGGFEPFSPEIYLQYLPHELLRSADVGTGAHNIFFQVLAEHGFTGLFLYAGLICSCLLSLRRMIWASKNEPSRQWIHNYAQMLEVSLFGYLASGMFLSMCYFDLFYHIVAIVAIMKTLLRTQEQQEQEEIQAPETVRSSFVVGLSPQETLGR